MAGKAPGVGARFGNNRSSLLSQHGVADPAKVTVQKENAQADTIIEQPISEQTAQTEEVLTETPIIHETESHVQEQQTTNEQQTDAQEVQSATAEQRFEALKRESLDSQMSQISDAVNVTSLDEKALRERVQRAEQQAVQEARSIVGYTYTTQVGTAYAQGSPVSPDAYRAHQDIQIADIAAALANETDPAVIQALLREKMDVMTQENSTRMATCLPKSREDCLRCPCNASCKRSLARYNIVTTSIRLPEDVKAALDIMINEDIGYSNITMSSVVTLALQAVVEPYIAVARQRLAERDARLEELRRKGIYVKK